MSPFIKNIYFYVFSVGIVIVLILILDYLLIFKHIRMASDSILSKKGQIESLYAQLANYEKIKEEVIRVNKERENLANNYSSPSSPLELFYLIENLAKKTNNEVETTIQESSNNIAFSLKTTGSFNDLLKFLFILESMPFKVDIQRIQKELQEGTSRINIVSDMQISPLTPLATQ